MIAEQTIVTNSAGYQHCHIKCISWSAIFGGAFVGVGLGFLLNLFGIAIGLSAFNNTPSGVATLAIGGFIGLLIGTIASMFFSGWVAGYLARAVCPRRHIGALYGFLAWCLALVLTIVLTAHVNHFISDHYHYLSKPNAAVISVTTDDAGALATTQIKVNDGRNVVATQAAADTEKAANNLGIAALLTFILFFVGALASCLGGYCALKCCADDSDCK